MNGLLKRAVDLTVATILLVVLSPVLCVIALTIRLTGSGPALFGQTRAGKDGKAFTCYKFRTMRRDVDPFGPSPKAGDDPRLTRIGKWLREYSLDELPQLVNIVLGDMSLVGPRPLYVSQVEEWDQRQRKRLLVKPGLTGLAQVSGRGALRREEKLELDVTYVERHSFWLDVKIAWRTLFGIVGRHEIYEQRYSRDEETRGD